MRVLVIFALASVALAAPERDWRKISGKDLKVFPVNGRSMPHKPSTRITNGTEAVPYSIHWQAGLFAYESFICGGTLIDELNVLTAAQCLIDNNGTIKVILGMHNRRHNEATQVEIYSSDFVYHEQYDSENLYNDIGLIRLPSPVALTRHIEPLPVDDSSCGDDYAGQEASVSGWGLESEEEDVASSVLREVTLPVISNSECAEYYGDYIQQTQLCTDSTEGKSICYGDAGGALVLDGYQIGIPSFVSNQGCGAEVPAGFTRVCQFIDWIEQNKKK